MKYLHKTVVLSALVLSFLPACGRIKLKPLPTVPARQDNQIHVEAHALDKIQAYDYLGFNFDKQSSLCAWHVIAYNPFQEDLSINQNSWSMKPSSIDDLHPYVRNQYVMYLPITISGGMVIGFGLAFTSFISLVTAAFMPNAIIATRLLYASIALGTCAVGTVVASPFLAYHLVDKKTEKHLAALLPQLFPNNGVIPAQSNIQGIVILPKESLTEPWQLQLFDQNDNTYSFEFNNQK